MDATPFTIAMVNRKGGCAKTGSCHQLSGAFAHMGYRVLLLDMDPQASLTQGFFGPAMTESFPKERTILALFNDAYDPDPAKLVIDTPFKNIAILPGANSLDDYNTPRPTESGSLQTSVRTFLREVDGQFDVIIIDCPPNLHLCSWNALLAADFVMVPLQPEDFGAQGITHIQRAIDLALEQYNPRLRMLGYLVTLRQRLALHDAYERQLRSLYGPYVFDAVFPLRKDFKEAIAERTPIHFLRPRSGGAKDVKAIADEILRRVPVARMNPPEFLHFENRVMPQELRKAVAS
jgi:chromosome partitioning protein